jgi:hypothetical protein
MELNDGFLMAAGLGLHADRKATAAAVSGG